MCNKYKSRDSIWLVLIKLYAKIWKFSTFFYYGARVGGGGGGAAREWGGRWRASAGAARDGVGDGGRARTRGGEMEANFRLFFVYLMG